MTSDIVYSIGFWGAPNLGDELLCKAVNELVTSNFMSEKHRVLTNSVDVTSSYVRLRSEKLVPGFFPTPEYFKNFKKHITAVSDADIITIGGGGLISDKYTWQAIPRYLIDALLAIALGKRVYFVGIGVLKLNNVLYKPLVRFLMSSASGVYLRDEKSKENLIENTGLLISRKVVIGPDLSHYLEFSSSNITKDYAVFNFRENPHVEVSSLKKIFQSTKCRKYVLLCAEPNDRFFYDRIKTQLSNVYNIEIFEPKSISEAIRVVDESLVVFSERLHVSAIAAELGKKSMFLAYESKVHDYVINSYSEFSMVGLDDFNNGFFNVDFKIPIKKCGVKEQLKSEVEDKFNCIMRKNNTNSLLVRFMSFMLFLIFICLGSTYAIALVFKRKIFGRGKFRIFNKEFG